MLLIIMLIKWQVSWDIIYLHITKQYMYNQAYQEYYEYYIYAQESFEKYTTDCNEID